MDAMAKAPTKLTAKLQRLFSGHPRQELAAAFGVHRQAINQYLNGSIPGPGTLLRIARYFHVPLEWLADDELPDNSTLPTAASLIPTEELQRELHRRYSNALDRVRGIFDTAERIDWQGVAVRLTAAESVEDAGAEIQAAVEVANQMEVLLHTVRREFSIFMREPNHEPTGDPKSTDIHDLGLRLERIMNAAMGSDVAARAVQLWARGRVFVVDLEDQIEGTINAIEAYRQAGGKFVKS